MVDIICPYCGKKAILHRIRSKRHVKFIWICEPCDAFITAEPRSKKPCGTMANKELRLKRIAAHRAFDVSWIFGPRPHSRTKAYKSMAKMLGLDNKQCHIANFDIETCDKVISHYGGSI